jgi:hypothetical protein
VIIGVHAEVIGQGALAGHALKLGGPKDRDGCFGLLGFLR